MMGYSLNKNDALRYNGDNIYFSPKKETYRRYNIINAQIRTLIEVKARDCALFYVSNMKIHIVKTKFFDVNLCIYYLNKKRSVTKEEVVQEIMQCLAQYLKENKDVRVVVTPEYMNNSNNALFLTQVLIDSFKEGNISHKKLTNLARAHIDQKVLGYMIKISGRINGYSIARTEKLKANVLQRNTLTNDIDFCSGVYIGKMGCIGVKVWLNKGTIPKVDELFKKEPNK